MNGEPMPKMVNVDARNRRNRIVGAVGVVAFALLGLHFAGIDIEFPSLPTGYSIENVQQNLDTVVTGQGIRYFEYVAAMPARAESNGGLDIRRWAVGFEERIIQWVYVGPDLDIIPTTTPGKYRVTAVQDGEEVGIDLQQTIISSPLPKECKAEMSSSRYEFVCDDVPAPGQEGYSGRFYSDVDPGSLSPEKELAADMLNAFRTQLTNTECMINDIMAPLGVSPYDAFKTAILPALWEMGYPPEMLEFNFGTVSLLKGPETPPLRTSMEALIAERPHIKHPFKDANYGEGDAYCRYTNGGQVTVSAISDTGMNFIKTMNDPTELSKGALPIVNEAGEIIYDPDAVDVTRQALIEKWQRNHGAILGQNIGVQGVEE